MWETTIKGAPYLQERTYDSTTGKARIISTRITPANAKGRKEAQKRLLERVEDSKPKPLHISDLIEMYEKELEKTVRYSTYKRNVCSINTMMEIIGDPYADRITAGYIRQKLIDSGREIVTLNELIKRFKSFLHWAYMNDFMERDVYDKLQKFPDPGKKQRIADKFLEKDELHDLLDAMDLDRWKLLTEFLALSGLRIGEAVALDGTDVDGEYITVDKSYTENFRSLGPTKTKGSDRRVYIQPELAEVIRKIRVCMMKQRMQYGYEDPGYFFVGIDGGRIGYAVYNKYLKEIAGKVVPNKTVTPHTLRHTMTSLFAEAGVSLEVISRRLGHESSALTKEIYFHVTKEQIRLDNVEVKSVRLLG